MSRKCGGAIYKRSRSLGVSIHGKAKDSINKRPNKPGTQGVSKISSYTEYAKRLREVQRLKSVYDLGEKQFSNLVKLNIFKKGDNVKNIFSDLESRLDIIVYRSNFAKTIYQAKQFISHGFFLINGKKVNIRSIKLKESDVISLTEKASRYKIILEAINAAENKTPEYIELSSDKMSAKFLRKPNYNEIPYSYTVDTSLIIEHYSR